MTSKKPLSEVTTFISRGISPKYDESGYVVINQRCIRDQRVDFSSARYSSREKTSVMPEKLVRQWDGLVNSTGVGTLGRVAQILRPVNSTIIDSHVTIVRPNLEQVDGRYFGYALFDIEKYIETLGIGATGQTELSRGRLSEVEIAVPSLPTQRKIAAILSAYDDLIENNLRRIKILEEMAQSLYREWFVKFRFPGHQHAHFTDSPLGRIPEGWEVKRLGDAFLIVLGGTPSRNRPEFWRNGTVPWINSGKVNDFRVTEPSELITELALKKSAAKLMPPGTTLIAITGATLGQVSILEIEASANQSVVGVISEDENLIEWLHLTIRERISSIINHASGGAQQHINKGIVDDVVVAVPPGNIAEKFRNIVHPLYRQIAGLIFKNITLRRTRDLLLPRLISGEVDVSELDIVVPEEAAA